MFSFFHFLITEDTIIQSFLQLYVLGCNCIWTFYLNAYRSAEYVKVMFPWPQIKADGNFNNSLSLSVFGTLLWWSVCAVFATSYDVSMNNAYCIVLHRLQVTEGGALWWPCVIVWDTNVEPWVHDMWCMCN